jgi:predicted DNA-binding transcriptional regulator AlpA
MEKRLLPDAKVRHRYGVSSSTLYRWDRNPAMNFPRPIKINGRLYRDEAELDRFDRERAAERETA